MAHVALIDVLDRDGQVRQTWVAESWPLRIGRALDNDLVLSDPHVAPQHCVLDRDELADGGVVLTVGDSHNGLQTTTAQQAMRHWTAGQRQVLVAADGGVGVGGEAPTHVEITLGLTRLRLRLPEFALAPELPFTVVPSVARRFTPIAVGAAVLLAALLFNTYLDNDPDNLGRAVGSMLMTAGLTAAVWCSAWALLSKTFTRHAHFLWHVRVFLLAAIALLAVEALPNLVSFVISSPVPADFAFVGTVAVGAATLYFHMLAVEPARHRLLKGMAVAGAVAGVLLMLWTNLQRTERYGDELYMSHLFPPSWRLAKPVAAATFIDGLARLKPGLDKQAASRGGIDTGESNDDEE